MLDYLGASGAIWDFLGLSGTIWNYLGLFRTILQLSRTRVQVEAGESKFLLFETFLLFYFFSLERLLEELALLKIYHNLRGKLFGGTVWQINMELLGIFFQEYQDVHQVHHG